MSATVKPVTVVPSAKPITSPPIVTSVASSSIPENINNFISNIIVREGGSKYTNLSADKGGPTKYGITQNTLSDFYGYKVTAEDVKNLTEEVAREIYYKKFVLAPNFNLLPSDIQENVVDAGVMSGSGVAVDFIVETLGILGSVVPSNTIIDNKIYLLLHSHPTNILNNTYCDCRQKFYNYLAKKYPSDKEFLGGWTNRANSFRIA